MNLIRQSSLLLSVCTLLLCGYQATTIRRQPGGQRRSGRAGAISFPAPPARPGQPARRARAKGPTGPPGIIPAWLTCREIHFAAGSNQISDPDRNEINGMAAYMNKNPSLQLGIDGYLDASNEAALDLSDRRINAVRDALVQAGMPAGKIKVGQFGNPKLRREGRVEVLLKTAD